MPTLTPDTRTRVALSELAEIKLQGNPDAATLTFLSDGTTLDWSVGETPQLKTCPELLTVSWQISGVTVSAEIDVVATRYCTIDEIRNYRLTEYDLSEVSDDAIWDARQRAEEVIETSANRVFQPVMRAGFVDRPNCTMSAQPIIPGACARDLHKVVRAETSSGASVSLSLNGLTAINVSNLKPRDAASVVLVMGMQQTPVEMHDAVLALAAWYLVPKAGPENATSESTDAGVLRYVIGGVDGAATSLPEVNALVQRYGFTNLIVG